MTRDEQLQRVKGRALAYLPDDIGGAITSFMSDAGKPYGDEPCLIDWTKPTTAMLSQLGMMHIMSGNVSEARRWIEGFN
jgi:hypothetical protein